MDTFAIDPISITQASPSSVFVPVQAGIGDTRIGPAPRAAGIDFSTMSESTTLDSLMRIGQKIIEPQVEIQRKKQALSGAVAALQGQTAADLAKGDIFGGVFGDPTAVAAARQVEKVNKVSDALTEIQLGMDEWRKKTPDEFRAYLPSVMEKHLTGDELSDSLITQGFIQQIPGLVEHHTKASISYQNQVALNTYGDRMRGALNWMQSFADARKKDPTAVDEDGVRAAAAWAMNEIASGIGMLDEKAAGKMAYNITRQMAAEGKFDALEVLVNSPITGVMSPEQQAMLPKVIESAKTEYFLTNPKFADLHSSLGEFQGAIDLGMVSKAQLEAWYAARVQDGSARILGLDNNWLKAQTEVVVKKQFQRAQILANGKATGPDPLDQIREAARLGQSMEMSGVTAKVMQATTDDAYATIDPRGRAGLLLEFAKTSSPYPTSVRMETHAALTRVAKIGVLSQSDISNLSVAYSLYKTNPAWAAKQYRDDPEAIKVLSLLDSNPDVFSGDPKVAEEARRSVGSILVASKNLPPPSDVEAEKAIKAELDEPFWQSLLPNAGFKQENAFVSREAQRLYKVFIPADMAVKMAKANFDKASDKVLSMPVLGNPGSGPVFRHEVARVAAGRYGKSHGAATIDDKQYDTAVAQAIKAKLAQERPRYTGTPTILNASYTADGSLQLGLDLDDGKAFIQLVLNPNSVAAPLLELLSKPKTPDAWEEDLQRYINP